MIYNNILETIGRTPIVRINRLAPSGVTLYVNGQTIGGAITKVEPGKLVELRSQEFSKIVVRWESIDGIALP